MQEFTIKQTKLQVEKGINFCFTKTKSGRRRKDLLCLPIVPVFFIMFLFIFVDDANSNIAEFTFAVAVVSLIAYAFIQKDLAEKIAKKVVKKIEERQLTLEIHDDHLVFLGTTNTSEFPYSKLTLYTDSSDFYLYTEKGSLLCLTKDDSEELLQELKDKVDEV